jgi:hypothetical protein
VNKWIPDPNNQYAKFMRRESRFVYPLGRYSLMPKRAYLIGINWQEVVISEAMNTSDGPLHFSSRKEQVIRATDIKYEDHVGFIPIPFQFKQR